MTEYFSHDYHARHDPKLQKILRVMGPEGIGLFWCIVENCYEQGGRILESECESIAFDMRTECERIKSVLQNFDLFAFDGVSYTSKSITKRINHRNNISDKARNSAEKRWKNAKAMPTQCEGNALKESKVKEIKEYSSSFLEFWKTYPKKKGKGQAWKEWLRESPPIENVLKTLSWQIKSQDWIKENGQYIPWPERWIKKRCWEDEQMKTSEAKNIGSLPGTRCKNPEKSYFELTEEIRQKKLEVENV